MQLLGCVGEGSSVNFAWILFFNYGSGSAVQGNAGLCSVIPTVVFNSGLAMLMHKHHMYLAVLEKAVL